MDLKIGGFYNWKYQPERLIYVGKDRCWHQFKKIGDPRPVWCEVLDEDLHMIEETTPRRMMMQALVPPPSSTGLDCTQHMQKHSAELEAELTAVKRRLNLEMDTTAQVEKKLVDALGVLSDRDIEIERLTFALKDKENELESVRDEHRTQIDGLMGDLDEMRQLFHDSLILRNQAEDETRRLKCKNKKRDADALLSSIDELWTLVKIHKDDIAGIGKELAVQGEMVASIQRHDGLISKAWEYIGNHSDSIYNQQQSIDGLWRHVHSMEAHINTGEPRDEPEQM